VVDMMVIVFVDNCLSAAFVVDTVAVVDIGAAADDVV